MDTSEVELTTLLRSLTAGTPYRGTVMRTAYTSTRVYTTWIKGTDCGCVFAIAPDEPFDLAANVDLKIVFDRDRKHKAGRALVELLEEFSRAADIRAIVIGANANPSFWEHMGYHQVSEPEATRYRTLARPGEHDFTIDFYENVESPFKPLHKVLRD
jgi:ribosomal protein L31E